MTSQGKESSCYLRCEKIGNAILDFANKRRGCLGCFVCLVIITLLLMIVMTIFVNTGMMDFSWKTMTCIANQITTTKDPSIAFANWLSLFVTSLACFFAWRAYQQSKRARKSAAFSMLFAQLLNSHREIFGNKALENSPFMKDRIINEDDKKITLLRKDWLTKLWRKIILKNANKGNSNEIEQSDVFSFFFADYKKKWAVEKDKELLSASEFVLNIWTEFVKNLREEPKFSHCFKYVYHEIKTVLDEESLDDNERKHYIGIIQANMNYNELFCYFINLLQHYSYGKKEIIEDKDEVFMVELRKNDFFGNIMEIADKEYCQLIKDLREKAKRGSAPHDNRIKEVIDKIVDYQ